MSETSLQNAYDRIEELELKLVSANERIKRLIAERDTARQHADQNYKLREEFLDLLGTDDVEQGVAVVCGFQERIKRLEAAGDAMLNAWLMPEDSMEYCDWVALSSDAKAKWNKAKEAKP
jgi:hypothetical protein